MMPLTSLGNFVNPQEFISQAARATTGAAVEALLSGHSITPEDQYAYNEDSPEDGWQPNNFHWIPVGRDRGNSRVLHPFARLLAKGREEKGGEVVNCGVDEIGLAATTTEGDELRGFVEPAQTTWQEHNLHPCGYPVQCPGSPGVQSARRRYLNDFSLFVQ